LEKKITQLDGCEKEIEITLTKNEIRPFIEKAYFEAQPKVELKGFRKGKVPMSVVKMHFGKQLEFEAKQDASNDFFQKIIKEENIKVVNQPVLKDINEDENGAVFTIVFEAIPEFELAEYHGLSIEEPVHRVTDEEIQHELLHMQINQAEIKPAEEAVNEMYVVKFSYRNVDEATGLPLLGESVKESQVFLHNHDIYPALRDKFIGLKVGDSFNYLPAPNDMFPPNQTVNITINGVEEVIPKELNDDFANQSSEGRFQTVEDLKTEIGFQLQEQWDSRSREQMEMQIMDTLVKLHDFANPPSFVATVLKEMAENFKERYKQYSGVDNLNSEEIAAELMPQDENRVKWEIIKSKIIEKEDLKIEDYDIDQFVETEAAKLNIDKQIIRMAVERNENIKENMLSKKVMDFLIDFAVTSEVEFGTDIHSHDHEHQHEHADHEHQHEEENE